MVEFRRFPKNSTAPTIQKGFYLCHHKQQPFSGYWCLLHHPIYIELKMPLAVNNSLPLLEFQVGTSDDDIISLLCHIDSFISMYTGNIHLQQWIITTNPGIAIFYKECNESSPFDPIKLDCTVPTSVDDPYTGTLTDMVEY